MTVTGDGAESSNMLVTVGIVDDIDAMSFTVRVRHIYIVNWTQRDVLSMYLEADIGAKCDWFWCVAADNFLRVLVQDGDDGAVR